MIEKAYKKLRLDALVIQQGRLVENTKSVNKEDLLSMVGAAPGGLPTGAGMRAATTLCFCSYTLCTAGWPAGWNTQTVCTAHLSAAWGQPVDNAAAVVTFRMDHAPRLSPAPHPLLPFCSVAGALWCRARLLVRGLQHY